MTSINNGARTCVSLLVLAVAATMACRTQTDPIIVATADGFTASCNGDFPSWISTDPPTADTNGDVNSHEPGVQHSFELAQSFPRGIPVFRNANGTITVDHYDPPQANSDAPWRAHQNLANATQRTQYLNALKSYILAGMSDPGIDFDASRNNKSATAARFWYHVPMMTGNGSVRREPYHGATMERGLRGNEQTGWLNSGPNLAAVAVGYYNFLGGYTIGQVFPSANLALTDPSKATFIDGTLVFKLLFAEYQPSRITTTPVALLHAPSWWMPNPLSSAVPKPLVDMRLLQVDVAVKDDHFTTGWVFATFVYDESLASSEPNAWKRLTPVGIMWGNDPGVTGSAVQPLTESWINQALPAAFAFAGHHGRAGRLIGPVDDPVSSCLSCHSTAEVDMAQQDSARFLAAANKPIAGCEEDWFRNLLGSVAFGHALACPDNLVPTGLTSLDYSLQLQRGVSAVFGQLPHNSNPCVGVSPPSPASGAPPPPSEFAKGMGEQKYHFRRTALPVESKLVRVTKAKMSESGWVTPTETNLR